MNFQRHTVETWRYWISSLSDMMTISRFTTKLNEKIVCVERHGFEDTSKDDCCLATYTVKDHPKGTSRKLITARSQISKKETLIPH